MSLTKDVNGKESSKRYWARRFFTLGFWLAILMFVMWIVGYIFIDKEFTIPEALVEIWIWMMGFSSAVVLGTVFERPDPRVKYYGNNNKPKEEDENIVIPSLPEEEN